MQSYLFSARAGQLLLFECKDIYRKITVLLYVWFSELFTSGFLTTFKPGWVQHDVRIKNDSKTGSTFL